jgi:hypothetical protein
MKAWFARHGPRAANNGTSYAAGRGSWLTFAQACFLEPSAEVSAFVEHRGSHRGAVAWLTWGGDAGFRWLFPDDKVALALPGRTLDGTTPADVRAAVDNVAVLERACVSPLEHFRARYSKKK